MKNFIFPFSFLLLFACNSNSENTAQTDFSNITISLDTVMVDEGEDIINLNSFLYTSAVDHSGTYLYNWDQNNFLLEKINLDKLILEEKIPFEQEGPNGVGSFVSWISLTDDNKMLISNYQNISLFDFTGKKIKTIKFRNEKMEGDVLEDYENFNWKSILANNGNQLYGILGRHTGQRFTLGIVDFESKTIKKYPLHEYDKLVEYTVKFISSQRSEIIAVEQFIDQIENRIIFSTAVFNSLMVYDIPADSLYKVKYKTTLTKNSKSGKYRNEVESKEEFRKVYSEIKEEINFCRPIWDSKNQMFYRFSWESRPSTTLDDGSIKFNNKIYLTILDKNFQVLGENLLKEINTPPLTHFVKDGKIWLFQNINDQLAFIRLSMN